jgi:MraZ protein
MSEPGSLGSKPRPIIGTDEATIDDKGRILVSKKKRERLGEPFVIALGTTGCLVAYPEPEWEKVQEEINRYDRINQGRERYSRLIFGLADDELRFDAQGRVVVPRKLRELAKLDEKVLLVGCGDRLEIWAVDEWREYTEYPDTYGQKRREAIEKAYTQMVANGSR